MATVKKIVVCGGNGFLGSRICKYAVARGWDVTSISRSGEPHWSSVTASASPPPWSHKVAWERADLLRPRTYTPLLRGADAVVHSMGILLEADYKRVLSGRESPLAGLLRAFAPASPAAAAPATDPLHRDPDADVAPPAADGQLTYEVMNRDSAVALAAEAAREQVGAFAYISAAGGAPVLPARYLSTKREAEALIAADFPVMRSVFVRPGFMYDSCRPLTVPLAAGVGAGALLNEVTGGRFKGFLGAAGERPLRVDLVAEAVVEALDDETVRGPLETRQIEELAGRAWRKGML